MGALERGGGICISHWAGALNYILVLKFRRDGKNKCLIAKGWLCWPPAQVPPVQLSLFALHKLLTSARISVSANQEKEHRTQRKM